MKRVIVEKFIDGELCQKISIPAFFLCAVNTLLPQSALYSLSENGINVSEIILAKKQRIRYEKTIYVVEKGIPKKVLITLD